MRDNIILVDIYGNQIGAMEKIEAHEKHRLHRAFSIFLFNKGKMLIQQRADHKYHSAGLWANSCCSHPRDGEDLFEAAARRLKEELFIEGVSLKETNSFVYFHQFEDGLAEYEYDHVLIGEYDGDITLNLEEVKDFKWTNLEELERELLNNPKKFSAWFLIACPLVMKVKREECD